MSSDPKKRVLAISQRPENQRCADCNCKLISASVWASSTLGIFVCINCSGRHRNLGTHITFIRSVTLDSWTNEQVDVMDSIGNEISNQYWEANLPKDYPRPATEDLDGLTKFIRFKYELAKWADKGTQPPNKMLQSGKAPKKNKMSISQSTTPVVPAPHPSPSVQPVPRSNSENLIDFSPSIKPVHTSSQDTLDILLSTPPVQQNYQQRSQQNAPVFNPFQSNAPSNPPPTQVDARSHLKSMLSNEQVGTNNQSFGNTNIFRNQGFNNNNAYPSQARVQFGNSNPQTKPQQIIRGPNQPSRPNPKDPFADIAGI